MWPDGIVVLMMALKTLSWMLQVLKPSGWQFKNINYFKIITITTSVYIVTAWICISFIYYLLEKRTLFSVKLQHINLSNLYMHYQRPLYKSPFSFKSINLLIVPKYFTFVYVCWHWISVSKLKNWKAFSPLIKIPALSGYNYFYKPTE